MDTLKILNPVKTVQTAAGPVTVREMPWRDAIGFLAELSKQAQRIISPSGQWSLSVDQLPAIITDASGLAGYLFRHAASLSEEQVAALRPVDALDILGAAIELNASPELYTRGKAVAGRLSAALRGQTGEPSTKSSPPSATP